MNNEYLKRLEREHTAKRAEQWQNGVEERTKAKKIAEPISDIANNIALKFERGEIGEAVYDTGAKLISKDGKTYKVGIVVMLDESDEE